MRRMLFERRQLEEAIELRTRELISQKEQVEHQKVEIERLLEESRASERLKSQFLANMSHEIRTPLNGVMGMTELALETDNIEKRREYLRLARDSAQSLLSIVNDVLDFSKIESGKLDLEPREFSVREFIEDTIRTVEWRVEDSGLNVERFIDPSVPASVVGDAGRLRQILLNLIDNAIKFTSRGTIEVKVSAESAERDQFELKFAIRDTGIGIAEEKQRLIFEPFRQADQSTTRRFGGTGLGLAIASQLTGIMGGRIWLESKEGVGSTFFFTVKARLPVAGVEAALRPAALRILLAEDHPINQRLLLGLLERQGHRVTLAADGEQAVAATDREEFDLILMDVQMPGMGGLEATTLIREREKGTGRHVPVVAMTANALEGDRERCLDAGMDDYLSKPIKTGELYEKIALVTHV